MKTALLASTATSFFLINFLNTHTRADEFLAPLFQVDTLLGGDIVLFTGALIIAAPFIGVFQWVRGEIRAKINKPTSDAVAVTADSGDSAADSNGAK